MYFVYILYSVKLRKKYIGFSSNLQQRITEHNSGKCDFTSKGMPWELIYYEFFKSEKDAREEEKFLKIGKGRERLRFLLRDTIDKIE